MLGCQVGMCPLYFYDVWTLLTSGQAGRQAGPGQLASQADSNITILQLDTDTLVPLPDPWHRQWPPACVTWTAAVFATPSVPLAG